MQIIWVQFLKLKLPMEHSKHNIFSKIADSESYFIVNPLSGHADILEPGEAQKYIVEKRNDLSSS